MINPVDNSQATQHICQKTGEHYYASQSVANSKRNIWIRICLNCGDIDGKDLDTYIDKECLGGSMSKTEPTYKFVLKVYTSEAYIMVYASNLATAYKKAQAIFNKEQIFDLISAAEVESEIQKV